MKENKQIESRFIPCGDSLEKMNAEINEEELETVSGGAGVLQSRRPCPQCGSLSRVQGSGDAKSYYCEKCRLFFSKPVPRA